MSKQAELKNSKLGIAGFVLSLVSIACLIVIPILLMSVALEAHNLEPDALREFFSSNRGVLIPVIIVSMITLITPVIGIVLSIVAVCQKNTKKGLTIAGLVINGIIILFFASVMIAEHGELW